MCNFYCGSLLRFCLPCFIFKTKVQPFKAMVKSFLIPRYSSLTRLRISNVSIMTLMKLLSSAIQVEALQVI